MERPLGTARAQPAAILLACVAALGCSSTVPRRDPTGAALPALAGETLDGEPLRLPADLRGAPAILLVGFEQEAQFDADRWLFGLLQAGTPVRVLEVPAIPGRIAGAFARSIDAGMRSGIPAEDWSSVVTLYGEDARRLCQLTGNEGGANMRALLIDGEGVIRWFHDRGFSARELLELDRRARALVAPAAGDTGRPPEAPGAPAADPSSRAEPGSC